MQGLKVSLDGPVIHRKELINALAVFVELPIKALKAFRPLNNVSDCVIVNEHKLTMCSSLKMPLFARKYVWKVYGASSSGVHLRVLATPKPVTIKST